MGTSQGSSSPSASKKKNQYCEAKVSHRVWGYKSQGCPQKKRNSGGVLRGWSRRVSRGKCSSTTVSLLPPVASRPPTSPSGQCGQLSVLLSTAVCLPAPGPSLPSARGKQSCGPPGTLKSRQTLPSILPPKPQGDYHAVSSSGPPPRSSAKEVVPPNLPQNARHWDQPPQKLPPRPF